MLKTIGGILLLTLSGLTIMFDMVGNHGHLIFRAHMTEDWIIWSIAFLFLGVGLYLLIKSRRTNSNLNVKTK